MKLGEIAERLGLELRGDPQVEIGGLAPIETAGAGELTFLAGQRYAGRLAECRAAAIILGPTTDELPLPALVAANPYVAFARALGLFHEPVRPPVGVHPAAHVDPEAELGPDCRVGPGAVIGRGARLGARVTVHAGAVLYREVLVGADSVLHAHSVVRERCRLGERCVLQPGAVIGADGFGFAPGDDGRFVTIPQTGITVLEDDVEVGANACVDRATMGETRIARGTKIDNMVQIGHNCSVGQDTVIAALTGVAGTTRIGNGVMVGGQCGLSGHQSIGDGARLAARTGVSGDVEPGAALAGGPQVPHMTWVRYTRILPKLPDMARTLKQLERRVAELEGES